MLNKFVHPIVKQLVGITVLIITGLLFVNYLQDHPQLLNSVRQLALPTVVILLILYCCVLLTNAIILQKAVQICNKTLASLESLLLTSYSSLVNFFGPLQSGPGFRAIYLRRKHGIGVKAYGKSTLLYYGCFGLFSLLMVGYGWQPLLASILIVILLIAGLPAYRYISRHYPLLIKHPLQVGQIMTITALQLVLIMSINFIELRTVHHSTSISQVLIYSGAANLALFVSLTPGAIGFRESFLLFSTSLHHLDTRTVLAASVIDRAIYFIFLGLLFLFTTGFQARARFKKPTP